MAGNGCEGPHLDEPGAEVAQRGRGRSLSCPQVVFLPLLATTLSGCSFRTALSRAIALPSELRTANPELQTANGERLPDYLRATSRDSRKLPTPGQRRSNQCEQEDDHSQPDGEDQPGLVEDNQPGPILTLLPWKHSAAILFHIEQWLLTGCFHEETRFESSLALGTNCRIIRDYHAADVTAIGLLLLVHLPPCFISGVLAIACISRPGLSLSERRKTERNKCHCSQGHGKGQRDTLGMPLWTREIPYRTWREQQEERSITGRDPFGKRSSSQGCSSRWK
jgi:hypothetical protein